MNKRPRVILQYRGQLWASISRRLNGDQRGYLHERLQKQVCKGKGDALRSSDIVSSNKWPTPPKSLSREANSSSAGQAIPWILKNLS
jgi:hypothetical protein